MRVHMAVVVSQIAPLVDHQNEILECRTAPGSTEILARSMCRMACLGDHGMLDLCYDLGGSSPRRPPHQILSSRGAGQCDPESFATYDPHAEKRLVSLAPIVTATACKAVA